MISSLLHECTCPDCGHHQLTDVQITFGCVRGIVYRVGDQLQWGRPEVGREAKQAKRVVVRGIAICTNCDHEWDVGIVIERDVIRSFQPVTDEILDNDYVVEIE